MLITKDFMAFMHCKLVDKLELRQLKMYKKNQGPFANYINKKRFPRRKQNHVKCIKCNNLIAVGIHRKIQFTKKALNFPTAI